MNQSTGRLLIVTLLTTVILNAEEVSWGAEKIPEKEDRIAIKDEQAENLLLNGSMEEGFYWKYPNHFIAQGWQRWWKGNVIPEYDDVRKWRPWRFDGSHAQVYFWTWHYTAGIFQRVTVQPCTLYQFSMYGRNHSSSEIDHHARIGIDQYGREYGLYMSSLPVDIAWSPEQTFFRTWGLHTVTAESLGDTITAITYVSPEPNDAPYDTFWDAGRLVAVPFPNNRLPEPGLWEPSGFITNVDAHLGAGDLLIEWNTLEPASTQVWYDVIAPTVPITPEGTLLISSTIYLPVVMSHGLPDREYDFATPLDTSPTTYHRVSIFPLKEGERVEFIVLSRRQIDTACTTEMYGPITTASMPPLFYVYLPLVTK
jgi:hypothetical protein